MFNENSKKVTLDKCWNVFKNYQDDLNEEKLLINNLYNLIEREYRKQLNDGELDIEKERLRIQKSLGNLRSLANHINNVNINDNTSYMACTIGIVSTANLLLANNTSFQNLRLIIGIPLLIFYIVFAFEIAVAIIKREKSNVYSKDIVNQISLKVLEKIENEIKNVIV